MATLEDIALASCLKSNIQVPVEYVKNGGISYDNFNRMLRKHDQQRYRRMMEVINKTKQMMVRDSLRQGWTNEKWREEVENLKRDCLRDYYSY